MITRGGSRIFFLILMYPYFVVPVELVRSVSYYIYCSNFFLYTVKLGLMTTRPKDDNLAQDDGFLVGPNFFKSGTQ